MSRQPSFYGTTASGGGHPPIVCLGQNLAHLPVSRPTKRSGPTPARSTVPAWRLPGTSNWFERQLATKKADAAPAAGSPAKRAEFPGTIRPYRWPTDSSDEAIFPCFPNLPPKYGSRSYWIYDPRSKSFVENGFTRELSENYTEQQDREVFEHTID